MATLKTPAKLGVRRLTPSTCMIFCPTPLAVEPYGIFDVQRNAGAIYVGTSADTPEFAVEAIARWWHEHGQAGYPAATRLLILADAGGSNGCRPPLWKAQVQSDLSDALR